MKHKHAELIHAWADGAEIQYKSRGGWVDAINPIFWHNDNEYRIKPEEKKPVVRWLWAIQNKQEWNISISFYTKKEVDHIYEFSGWKYFPLEYTRTEFPK